MFSSIYNTHILCYRFRFLSISVQLQCGCTKLPNMVANVSRFRDVSHVVSRAATNHLCQLNQDLQNQIKELETKHKIFIIGSLSLAVIFGLNFLFLPSSYTTQEYKQLSRIPAEVDMNSFRAVFVTVPSAEVGKKIAHGLVSNKLAACVNIIPQITSVYEWEGKIEEDSEQLLMIKTQAQHFEELEKFVKANHPYTVPEVIGVPIEQGSQDYLDWIQKVTKKGSAVSESGANFNN